jgi:putative transposase
MPEGCEAIHSGIKKNLGVVFHDLARRRELLMTDHVHMLVSIPPKYSVAEMIGFINLNVAVERGRFA